MSPPEGAPHSKSWVAPLTSFAIAIVMTLLGLTFVMLGGYLGSQVFTTGPGLWAAVSLSFLGMLSFYGGLAGIVVLALFWAWVLYSQNSKRSQRQN